MFVDDKILKIVMIHSTFIDRECCCTKGKTCSCGVCCIVRYGIDAEGEGVFSFGFHLVRRH